MTQKLAIIHTTPVTVESLKALAAELLPDTEVINFVDDSILPQLAGNSGDVSAVAPRLLQYGRFAQELGADVILSACSSVGEGVATMRRHLAVPVVRIDEAMAEEAVRRATRIGVAATLATTLKPTLALLRAKAEEANKEPVLEPLTVDAAYRHLLEGDREAHDEVLAAALEQLADRVEVVVLAQASMAGVLPRLPEALRKTFLTSPRLAMEHVKRVLATS